MKITPINKYVYMGRLSDADRQLCDAMVEKINFAIEQSDASTKGFFLYKLPNDLPFRVKALLWKVYEGASWNVMDEPENTMMLF